LRHKTLQGVFLVSGKIIRIASESAQNKVLDEKKNLLRLNNNVIYEVCAVDVSTNGTPKYDEESDRYCFLGFG
jgi:hypothetical protein